MPRKLKSERAAYERQRYQHADLRDHKLAGQRKRHAAKTIEARRDRAFRSVFGISIMDYDAILKAQDNCCAICGCLDILSGGRWKGRLHVDHDHTTGEVRGLLCYDCNTGIGKLQDNIDVLESAITYLKRKRQ